MSLRFCFVTTFYPPYHFGGDAMCVYRLAESLARRGHTVDVAHSVDAYRLSHPAEPGVAYQHHPNVRVHSLQSARPGLASLVAHQTGRPAGYGAQLRELLGSDAYDVIHYHNVSLMGGPGVLRLGNAPKLYTAHEYWLVCPTHVLFRNGREACTKRTCLPCTLRSKRPPQLWRHTGHIERCVASVDQFLMPSEFAMAQHQAAGIQRPMRVLPHFVPAPTSEQAGAAQDAGSDSELPYFLFVGRLEKLKGVQDLLKLFREERSARLLVVGDGQYRPELERLAQGLEHVSFLGQVHPERLGSLYRGAVAVLGPSLCYEVFNLIPVEAFAHGTPAIVRNLGATPELVAKSGAGMIFETLEQCRHAMLKLLSDKALRDRLGALARVAYATHWTEDVHLATYLEIVNQLVQERAAPGGARS